MNVSNCCSFSACQARYTHHIQDQRHPAVAENRRPGQALDVAVVRLEALHDHLLLGQQLVDREPDALAVDLDHHQQAIVIGFGSCQRQPQRAPQIDDRHQLVAQPVQLALAF
jgi:hypothetical protein